MHIVGQVVDVSQAMADGRELGTGQGFEVDVVKADVADVAWLRAILAAPAVNEVDDRIANAFDRRNVQFAGTGGVGVAPGTEGQGALVGQLGVSHAKGDGADAGAVQAGKALGEGVGLGVHNEVDLALAVQHHVFVTVPGHGFEPHAFKQLTHGLGVGCGVFNEFEPIGAHRVVPGRAVGVVGRGRWGRGGGHGRSPEGQQRKRSKPLL